MFKLARGWGGALRLAMGMLAIWMSCQMTMARAETPTIGMDKVTAGSLVISGHRDTHFRFLEKVQNGEIVAVEDQHGVTHAYRVTGSGVVDARTRRLKLAGEEARLILVTCWSFDAVVPGGPLRYVVYAEKHG